MKSKKNVLKVIILIMVAAILVFIAGMAFKLLKEDYTEEKQFKDIQKAVEKADDEDILSKLKKRNSDVIGYLEIPDTTISYPVMQSKDNPDFYLTHDIDKNYSFLALLICQHIVTWKSQIILLSMGITSMVEECLEP